MLTFKSTPDYENPHDHNTDNVYKITVRASDGSLTASRNVTITVTDVNESPTVTIEADDTSVTGGREHRVHGDREQRAFVEHDCEGQRHRNRLLHQRDSANGRDDIFEEHRGQLHDQHD